ncbi:MAG: hypothetical protein NTY14_01025 [Candidatus Omnitrophica bacterium]|nr:hypothetical protein [Candidatus Omnitrophota bacterium]
MKILKLVPQKATPRILAYLEKKKLIRTLKPPRAVAVSQAKNGAMDTIYCSNPRWGAHKLICVKKNSPEISLNFHPENEEFIIINNNGTSYRPLCIVMGLLKQKELLKKLREDKLNKDDFIAVVFEHNDHKTCIFTMLSDTVHCEIALPGKGQGPVFFVAEPSRLKLNRFKTRGYKLEAIKR